MEPSRSVGSSQFWLRKLHSLAGFVFLGYFVCLHVRGAGAYESPALRIFFLYLPLLFHGLYGLYLCWESHPNNLRYGRYVRNWMYLLQRVSGLGLLPFLFIHVAAERHGWSPGAWYPAVWYGGMALAVFHLSNGIFGTLIHWGITVGPFSQRVFVGVSFCAFLILFYYGAHTLATGGYF